MRAVLLPLLLLLMACDGIPPNPPQTRGAVAYIPRTRQLWIDAVPYVLPPDIHDQHIRNGDIVNVVYHPDAEGNRVITRIRVEERFSWGPWR